MKLDTYDKENIRGAVSRPFFNLAKKIDGKTTKKLAVKVFREDVVPGLLQVRDMFPDFWSRLDPATHFIYETPKETKMRRYRFSYHNAVDSQTIEIPPDIKELGIPELNGITSSRYARGSGEPLVTQELMKAKASEEDRETIQKAFDLRAKGEKVAELLQIFLEPFTMPEQVPYSLPQLNYFMQQIDFRKRNKWTDKPPMMVQKRPRVTVPPPTELRQLVVEATMLAQAMPQGEED